MSVRKRQGSPFYVFDFSINGVRFRGSTGKTTRAEAKLIEADEKHRAQRLTSTDRDWTLRQIFGAYWNEVAKHRAGHKTMFRQMEHLSDILGRDLRASKLEAVMLMDYRTRRRGTAPKGRQIRLHSVNRDFALLHAALTHCAKLHRTPMPMIDWKALRAKEPDHRRRFLSREEWAALFAADASIQPILLCAVATGLRKSNILKLDWDQVKMGERMIHVVLKGGREHTARIGPPLMAVLALTPPAKRKGRVFDTTNFRKRWDAAVKAAKLSNVKFHDLRHTFASWARQKGADIADIKEALGHTSVSMTMRYAHITPDEHVTAFDRVSASLGTISVTDAEETAENREKSCA